MCRLYQCPLGRRNGGLVGPGTFFVKWNGNETVDILLLWFRSNPVFLRGARMVDVKLQLLRPGFLREVLVWLEGLVFFLREPEPFDVVKDTLPAFDGSLYFFHVVLLICLYVGTVAQCLFVVHWSVALHKGFDFPNVEFGVSFPLVGER